MINVVFGIGDDLSVVKKNDDKDILPFVKGLYETFIQRNLKNLKSDFFAQRVKIVGIIDSDFNYDKLDVSFVLSEFSDYLQLLNRVDDQLKGVNDAVQKD